MAGRAANSETSARMLGIAGPGGDGGGGVGLGGVGPAVGPGGVGSGGAGSVERRYQAWGVLPLMPDRNRLYSYGPAITGPARENVPGWVLPPVGVSTTRMPLPSVRPPPPPALRTAICVGPAAPMLVRSTTRTSDCDGAPSLSTESSRSEPPLRFEIAVAEAARRRGRR